MDPKTGWVCGQCGLAVSEVRIEHDCILELRQKVSELQRQAREDDYRLRVLGKCCRKVDGAVEELKDALGKIGEKP